MASGKAKGSFGVKALSYIAEKRMERRLGRTLNSDTDARPLSWGHLLEKHVFDQLGLEYRLQSHETIEHSSIDWWCGSPDAMKFGDEMTVVDFKAPYTLKAFCELVDPLYEGKSGEEVIAAIRENHEHGEKYYWQILSNAILTGAKYGELIVYAPFVSELEAIRELSRNWSGDKQHRFRWVDYAADDELTHILDGGFYKSINIVRWEISEQDKKDLTVRVTEAGKELVKIEQAVTA